MKISRRNRPWKRGREKILCVCRLHVHGLTWHIHAGIVAHPCRHHQEATRQQSTSSLSMKVNKLHLAPPPQAIEGN
jgi:hypothetical protein